MKICKYCKKPILDDWVWNPDSEGNGYHHAYLYEMEFRSRDRQIYDKGRADVLDKIRAEIKQYQSDYDVHGTEYDRTAWKAFNRCLQIIDKYKADIKPQESEV